MSAAASIIDTPAAAFGVARSFSGRRWVLPLLGGEAARAMALSAEIPLVLAELLVTRGMGADDLYPTLKQLLPDPCTLKDMDRAVARVKAAVESGE